MADIERTRTREREPQDKTPYDMFMRLRQEFHDRQSTGQVVVSLDDREYHTTKQGKLLYYLNSDIYKNTPLQDWRVFTHSLINQSGKHRHQGGLVIYVIEGKGWSIVDDERVDWEGGDLLLLPIKKGGVTHQHFNAEPGSECHWIAFSYMPFFDYNASEFTQVDTAPMYKGT
jgi:hypothetical protein